MDAVVGAGGMHGVVSHPVTGVGVRGGGVRQTILLGRWGASMCMEKSLFGGKQNETGLSTENFRKISNAFYLAFHRNDPKITVMYHLLFQTIPMLLDETRSRISGERWNCSFH